MDKIEKDKLGNFVFASRWLQAPLYVGLMLAQAVYVYRFMLELSHLIVGAVVLTENNIMLLILGLVDIVMVANLLCMIIIGGYEIFIRDIKLSNKTDELEWMSVVNAGLLKVKLSMALIGISSIHLLKTFINIDNISDRTVFWQILIHVVFVFSAYYLSKTEQSLSHS